MGDELSARGVFHLVHFFRQSTKFAQALGMTLFTLTLVIFLITAGFVFLRGPGV